ncbi:MAG: hypothetical protein L7W43_06115 [Rubripirellula sp.]|nr:hypothetical protein [Rubripirellula sp.]
MLNRFSLISFLFLGFSAANDTDAQQRDGNPAEHLPANIRQITFFGERPDWSHDGERILFLSKVFGDIYELELSTGVIRPCTDHFKHYGFTRALYLSNGDILLSGPIETFDRVDPEARQKARSSSFLSVLHQSFKHSPTPLDVHCDEGPAVSRGQLKIAWTHGLQDRISMGEIVYEGETPKLVNREVILTREDFPESMRPHRWIETQNFVPPDDNQLTVTGYEINNTANSEAFLLDLKDSSLVNISQTPDAYEEVEGIFPDGKFTLVKRADHKGNHWPLIDAWKLALDGSGQSERLTFFTEFKSYKGGEPTVSPDGRHIAFTLGKSGMEAGQGFGIFVMDMKTVP